MFTKVVSAEELLSGASAELVHNHFLVNNNGASTETFTLPSSGKYLVVALHSSSHSQCSVTIECPQGTMEILDEQNIFSSSGCAVKAILITAEEGATVSATYGSMTGYPNKLLYVFKLTL